jgi:hypothetical protein
VALEAAAVLAERHPRLVVDDLERHALSLGEPDGVAGPRAGCLDDGRQRGLEAVDGHAALLLPALVPVGQSALAGEELLQLCVGRGEDVLVGERRPHAVAALDLVRVRGGIAGEGARVGAQARDLIAEPAVGDVVEQCLGVVDETARLDRLCGRDRRGQPGRPVVRVDDPVDVAAEPEAQQEVALGDGPGHATSLRVAPRRPGRFGPLSRAAAEPARRRSRGRPRPGRG